MSQAIQQTKTTNLADHQAKTKEKEQLVELNDQFVAYIHKVCKLEQENKSLETRLKILQEQEIYKGNTEDLIKQFESNLKRQIAELTQDKQKLGEEITKSDEEIKNTSAKFKSALQKKQQQENKFDAAKKDADEVNLHHVELKLKLEHLLRMMEFLKLGYKEEKKELQSRIHKEKVVVQVDSSRELDMDETLREVKRQYEEMAAHSREEAEQWHKWKMDKMLQKAEKHAQDVDDINKEIKEISTTIQKLSDELKSLKEIEKDLETKVIVTKDMKESSLYKEIADQESILQKENQKLVQQARKYQELMNIKLAMDMEIATYRELLEGEETRLISGTNISRYSYSSSISSSILPPQLTPSLSTTLPVPRNQPPLQPQNPSIPPVISKPIEKAKP